MNIKNKINMSTTVCSSNNKLLNQNYDIITKVLIYIKNKIVKYRQYYVSEEKRKQNMEKNRKRRKMKRLTHFLV